MADALDVDTVRAGLRSLDGLVPDVVMTDVPYERQTGWHGSAAAAADPVRGLVAALGEVLPAHAVVVVTTQARKVPLPGVPLLARVRVGTRASALVRAGDGGGAG